jgi:hypothetical protein
MLPLREAQASESQAALVDGVSLLILFDDIMIC